MNQKTKTCWPSPTQNLLLRATLLKGQDAINAWEQWIALVDFDNIDLGSQRLVPLLYRNLLDNGVQGSLMALYKGVYRRFWLKNQFLFNRTKPVLEVLHKLGIETLLFKGAGIVVGCDLSYALRPMDDIDFLVRKEDAQIAINAIRELGWKPKNEYWANYDSNGNAVMYYDGKNQCIDLHWHSLKNKITGNHENGYWKRSFNANIDKIPIRIMGTTDHLIHTCVHGIKWNPIPPIRWIADAIILLNNSKTTTQWDHLLEHSERLRVTLPMFHGLCYLKNNLDILVPDYVLRSLDNMPVSKKENWYYQISIKKPIAGFGGDILHTLNDSVYNQKQYAFPGFLRYLQHRWHVRYLWQVPLEGALRTWRKIKFTLFKQKPPFVIVPSIFQK